MLGGSHCAVIGRLFSGDIHHNLDIKMFFFGGKPISRIIFRQTLRLMYSQRPIQSMF